MEPVRASGALHVSHTQRIGYARGLALCLLHVKQMGVATEICALDTGRSYIQGPGETVIAYSHYEVALKQVGPCGAFVSLSGWCLPRVCVTLQNLSGTEMRPKLSCHRIRVIRARQREHRLPTVPSGAYVMGVRPACCDLSELLNGRVVTGACVRWSV